MGGNDQLTAGLQRVAALHGELALAYENLVKDVENSLADLGNLSVTAMAPMKPSTTTARQSSRDESMVKTKELAEILNCHHRTVRRLDLAGRIPKPIGEGRLKRWRRKDIAKLLAEGFAQE